MIGILIALIIGVLLLGVVFKLLKIALIVAIGLALFAGAKKLLEKK